MTLLSWCVPFSWGEGGIDLGPSLCSSASSKASPSRGSLRIWRRGMLVPCTELLWLVLGTRGAQTTWPWQEAWTLHAPAGGAEPRAPGTWHRMGLPTRPAGSSRKDGTEVEFPWRRHQACAPRTPATCLAAGLAVLRAASCSPGKERARCGGGLG